MKTKKSFVKFVSAFVMALMLCVSFGVCSGFTVKADTQAEANPLAEQDTLTVQAQVQPREADPVDGYSPTEKYKRPEEVLITDAGQMKNYCDVVRMYEFMPYTQGQMIDFGFRYMRVTLNLQFRLVDHGYQWFYLYSSLLSDSMVRELNFDNVYSEEYKWYNVVFENVPIKVFEDIVVIRYDGSGKYDDDWYNRNLTVTFEYYKTMQ